MKIPGFRRVLGCLKALCNFESLEIVYDGANFISSHSKESLLMKSVSRRITTSLFLLIVTALFSLFASAAKPQTFTGKVSDAMCGAHHMMEGDPAGCLRSCLAKGSKYALVVGDKVYTLESSDKATLAELDKLADQNAKVTGEANGDSIQVKSVAPAGK
jgi:hypothetical protein